MPSQFQSREGFFFHHDFHFLTSMRIQFNIKIKKNEHSMKYSTERSPPNLSTIVVTRIVTLVPKSHTQSHIILKLNGKCRYILNLVKTLSNR